MKKHEYSEVIDMCNKLYMDCDFELKSLLEKELNKKIQGYKAQDIKKDIYDSNGLITDKGVTNSNKASISIGAQTIKNIGFLKYVQL
jgi:hypothetical protein